MNKIPTKEELIDHLNTVCSVVYSSAVCCLFRKIYKLYGNLNKVTQIVGGSAAIQQ